MVFKDRYDAGLHLADRLSKLKLNPHKTVIFALARGGVIVGRAIADRLGIHLEVGVIRKLGAPMNPELAIGAVAASGKPVLDEWLIADLKVSRNYIRREIQKKREEAKERETRLRILSDPSKFKKQTVVVVDDGLATGQTAKAAGRLIKEFLPKKIILAVPCASPSAISSISEDYDEIISLRTDENLVAVGQFYRDFSQVTDEEVKNILERGVREK